MVARPVMRIRDGRHLLQERLTDTYIANDTAIEGGEGRQFSSMVSYTKRIHVSKSQQLTVTDDSHRRQWIRQEHLRKTSRIDCVHGADRELCAGYLGANRGC